MLTCCASVPRSSIDVCRLSVVACADVSHVACSLHAYAAPLMPGVAPTTHDQADTCVNYSSRPIDHLERLPTTHPGMFSLGRIRLSRQAVALGPCFQERSSGICEREGAVNVEVEGGLGACFGGPTGWGRGLAAGFSRTGRKIGPVGPPRWARIPCMGALHTRDSGPPGLGACLPAHRGLGPGSGPHGGKPVGPPVGPNPVYRGPRGYCWYARVALGNKLSWVPPQQISNSYRYPRPRRVATVSGRTE